MIVIDPDGHYLTSSEQHSLTIGACFWGLTAASKERFSTSIGIAAGYSKAAREISVQAIYVDEVESDLAEKSAPGLSCSYLSATSHSYVSNANRIMRKAFGSADVNLCLLLSPEVILHRKSIKAMLDKLEANPNSIIGARHFPEELSIDVEIETGKASWVSSNCILIPRKVYEAVGGFDGNLPAILAGIDFCFRAQALGFGVFFAERAMFATTFSDRHTALQRATEIAASRELFMTKWPERKLNWEKLDEFLQLEKNESGPAAALKDPNVFKFKTEHLLRLNLENLVSEAGPRW
ncbi:MAG: hypothetical protein IAF58_03700 [Leptolyngbya sp.]|nr:hypothetical protein [Candidatus Melainabacteria bacterium]